VVTLQNGLGNEEQIAALVGPERVLGGLCFIAVTRERPGELTGYLTPGTIILGEFNRPAGASARAVAQAFERAGVRVRVVDNLAEARWQKLVWNIPFNGLAVAAGGITTDRILADPALAGRSRWRLSGVSRFGGPRRREWRCRGWRNCISGCES
jgi:2-dehydropantoate 2-reductase